MTYSYFALKKQGMWITLKTVPWSLVSKTGQIVGINKQNKEVGKVSWICRENEEFDSES